MKNLPKLFQIDSEIELKLLGYPYLDTPETVKVLYTIKDVQRTVLIECGAKMKSKIHYGIEETKELLKDEFYILAELKRNEEDGEFHNEANIELMNLEKTSFDLQKIAGILNAVYFLPE